ncbi:Uncharacterised protein [Mycobacteroides abscessus subsp. abscessus]|nr:Uncharacterised protein [Mycobacteroides abscessus subsp. abscessus]
MRVILSNYVTDCFSTFTEIFIICVTTRIHSIQNTSLNRFEPITNVWQCTLLNDVFTISTKTIANNIF